jgi:hypothetical protein
MNPQEKHYEGNKYVNKSKSAKPELMDVSLTTLRPASKGNKRDNPTLRSLTKMKIHSKEEHYDGKYVNGE